MSPRAAMLVAAMCSLLLAASHATPTDESIRRISITETCPAECLCMPTKDVPDMMDVVCASKEDVNDNPPEDISVGSMVELVDAVMNNSPEDTESNNEDVEQNASVEDSNPSPIEINVPENSTMQADAPRTITAFNDKEVLTLKKDDENRDESDMKEDEDEPVVTETLPADVPIDDEIPDAVPVVVEQPTEAPSDNDVMQGDQPAGDNDGEDDGNDEEVEEEEEQEEETPEGNKEVPEELVSDPDAVEVPKKGTNLHFNDEVTAETDKPVEVEQPVAEETQNNEDSDEETADDAKLEGEVETPVEGEAAVPVESAAESPQDEENEAPEEDENQAPAEDEKQAPAEEDEQEKYSEEDEDIEESDTKVDEQPPQSDNMPTPVPDAIRIESDTDENEPVRPEIMPTPVPDAVRIESDSDENDEPAVPEIMPTPVPDAVPAVRVAPSESNKESAPQENIEEPEEIKSNDDVDDDDEDEEIDENENNDEIKDTPLENPVKSIPEATPEPKISEPEPKIDEISKPDSPVEESNFEDEDEDEDDEPLIRSTLASIIANTRQLENEKLMDSANIVLPDGEVLLTVDEMAESMSGKMISDESATASTQPQQSTASWVILGLILATFVGVLGYATIKGRLDKKKGKEIHETIVHKTPINKEIKINRKPDIEGTEMKVLSHPLLQAADEDTVIEFTDKKDNLQQVVVADVNDVTIPYIDDPQAGQKLTKPPRKSTRAPPPPAINIPESNFDDNSAPKSQPDTVNPALSPTLVRARIIDNSPRVARVLRNKDTSNNPFE